MKYIYALIFVVIFLHQKSQTNTIEIKSVHYAGHFIL